MYMDDFRLISRGLYRVVGYQLGTEKVVEMRRRVMALQQSLTTASFSHNDSLEDKLFSGSRCEGFRFVSSDADDMFIYRNIRVIFSLSTREQYVGEQTFLLAERNPTKPGFALLKLLNNSSNAHYVTDSCVQYGDGCYVASQKWTEIFTTLHPNFTTHGPCSTSVSGIMEVDYAFCFKSDKLPKEAHTFIRRLHRVGWPSAPILQRITSGGCHFVAIGAKGSPTELMEWRISFSATEKILIHSMNHVQFLCYGLLKIFLKEAIDINIEVKGLLCSYFLKTALFWEIATNNLEWNTSNFLSCFWTCFQRLLQWINNEYCPNFFIPENNMFVGKIQGASRCRLLLYLVPLYQEGYNCLLRCPSINNELYAIIQRPLLANVKESYEQEKCEVDVELILEVWNYKPLSGMVQSEITKQIQDLDHVISTNDSDFEQEILQLWRNYLIQDLYISSCIKCSVTLDEDLDQSRQYSIAAIPVFDVSRHLLYTALYHYRRGLYSAAISLLRDAKIKLQHPYLMYPGQMDVAKYRAAGGEHKPFTQMMKDIVAGDVDINTHVTMPELTLENHAAACQSVDNIIIPPLVFTNFMFFLSYHHMGMFYEAQLQELSMLVQYDNGYHIFQRDKAISWQILGICQEMSGDNQGAYQSFRTSMKQKFCRIDSASVMRISVIIYKCLMGRC